MLQKMAKKTWTSLGTACILAAVFASVRTSAQINTTVTTTPTTTSSAITTARTSSLPSTTRSTPTIASTRNTTVSTKAATTTTTIRNYNTTMISSSLRTSSATSTSPSHSVTSTCLSKTESSNENSHIIIATVTFSIIVIALLLFTSILLWMQYRNIRFQCFKKIYSKTESHTGGIESPGDTSEQGHGRCNLSTQTRAGSTQQYSSLDVQTATTDNAHGSHVYARVDDSTSNTTNRMFNGHNLEDIPETEGDIYMNSSLSGVETDVYMNITETMSPNHEAVFNIYSN